MSVETSIKGQFDRIAAGRQAQKAAFATGNDFWTKVDAAGDETYENRVKGTTMTALDTALANGTFWSVSALRAWFTLHQTYFQTDLALASPYFASYLASKGWRIPYEAGEAYYEAMVARLGAQYVFPKGTKPAETTPLLLDATPIGTGMHEFQSWIDTGGTEAYAIVDGPLTNCYAPVMINSLVASPTSAGTPTLTATLQDASTKDIAFTPSATQYGYVVLGQQVMSNAGGAAAGQKDVILAATAQFKASEWVLLVKADLSVFELAQINTLTGTPTFTLTMKSNLLNTFAQNDFVWPMFTNAVRKQGTIANDKTLRIYARPDRVIAL